MSSAYKNPSSLLLMSAAWPIRGPKANIVLTRKTSIYLLQGADETLEKPDSYGVADLSVILSHNARVHSGKADIF